MFHYETIWVNLIELQVAINCIMQYNGDRIGGSGIFWELPGAQICSTLM